ncbi:MAG: CBS domain-containing protein [Deltaproteobacteria bacterium]|nr:CBS domain-containing protein [Deltaproteobacteria bacterium]
MITVRDLLGERQTRLATVEPDRTVRQAAERMGEAGVGSLLVTDAENHPVGMITERDILRRVLVPGRDPQHTRVEEVMTQPLRFCDAGTTLSECRRLMLRLRCRHLVVLQQGQVAGLITMRDIVNRELQAQGQTIHYLKEYLYGYYR